MISLDVVRNCKYQMLPYSVINSSIHATGVGFFSIRIYRNKKRPSTKLRKGIHPGCICGTSAQLNFLKFREYSIYK